MAEHGGNCDSDPSELATFSTEVVKTSPPHHASATNLAVRVHPVWIRCVLNYGDTYVFAKRSARGHSKSVSQTPALLSPMMSPELDAGEGTAR